MKSNSLHIVHIVEAFGGGVSTYLRLVLPGLVDRGFEVTLICSLHRGCPAARKTELLLRDCGIEILIVPMTRSIRPVRDICSLIKLFLILQRGGFDIVHTHCSKAGVLGRIAAFLAGVKTILHTPHCFAFLRCRHKLRRLLYLNLERCLGMITTKMITVSQSEATIAIRWHIVPRSRCIVVDNALHADKSMVPEAANNKIRSSKRLLGIGEDSLIVSAVSRLVDYKGVFRFLHAAEKSSWSNVIFLVAGEGELRCATEEYVNSNGLAKKVKLLGYMDNIEDIYRISDVIVLCSDAEGQPYSLLEAMRARRAIIATSVPGNNDLIIHNQTGYLTETKPAAIARAIDILLQDASRRRRYGDNAYVYFCRHHLLDSQVARLTVIYQSFMVANREQAYATASSVN